MKYIKLSQFLKSDGDHALCTEDLNVFLEKYTDLASEMGLIAEGSAVLTNEDPPQSKIIIKQPTVKERDYFRTGETMMNHQKKYEAYKTGPAVAAMYNANAIEEGSTDDRLAFLETKFCRSMFKILVVDDNKEVAEILFDNIKDLGFENVKLAHSGEEAIELMKKHRFTMILSDYKMPGVTGFHVFKAAQEFAPEAIFVMVSGYTDFEQDSMKKAGVLVLPKPYSVEKLHKIVKGFYRKFIEKKLMDSFKEID